MGATHLHYVYKSQATPRLYTQEVSPSQPPGPFETVLKRDFAQAGVLQFCVGPPSSKIYLHVESVQKFGCRVISREWNSDYPTPLTCLQLPTLRSHRKQQRLIMCYKILMNKSSIPPSHFIPHPSPSPCLHHDKALFIPLVKTTSFKSPFFCRCYPTLEFTSLKFCFLHICIKL